MIFLLITRVSKLLDIKYPLLQGGMAWIATGKLAGAVSEAGGLGIIGAGSAEDAQRQNNFHRRILGFERCEL